MIDSNKANEILSTIDGGGSLIVVGKDGGVRAISSQSVSVMLQMIQNDSELFLEQIRKDGAEPIILGIYDELQVPRQTPESLGSDKSEYTKNASELIDGLDDSELRRDQVLLLVTLKDLRFYWFRRPLGEPEQIEEMISNSPITNALEASPKGTINRLLLDAAVEVRQAL